MIVIVALICLAAVAALGGLTLYARARLGKAEARRNAAEAALASSAANFATAPLAGFLWHPGASEPAAIAAAPASFTDFLAGLEPDAVARTGSAVVDLRVSGTPFDLTAARRDGGLFALAGRRSRCGDALLWVTDITGTHVAETAQRASDAAAAALRAMIETIPVPVWRRDPNLALVDCNSAYATALDTTRVAALADRRELAPASGRGKALELARAAASGETRTERQHVVIGGSRRLIEITETPDRAGGTIGFAIDRTDLEGAEAELSRHINAHAEVLESIDVAIAIYGADKRLNFFNTAFAAAVAARGRLARRRVRRSTNCWSGCASAAACPSSPISAPSSASSWRCSPR